MLCTTGNSPIMTGHAPYWWFWCCSDRFTFNNVSQKLFTAPLRLFKWSVRATVYLSRIKVLLDTLYSKTQKHSKTSIYLSHLWTFISSFSFSFVCLYCVHQFISLIISLTVSPVLPSSAFLFKFFCFSFSGSSISCVSSFCPVTVNYY